jgi:hypothetical protein
MVANVAKIVLLLRSFPSTMMVAKSIFRLAQKRIDALDNEAMNDGYFKFNSDILNLQLPACVSTTHEGGRIAHTNESDVAMLEK